MAPGGPDVRAIFTAALELPPGPERDAYVAAACGGDAGLRRHVEALLVALAQGIDVPGPGGPALTEADAPTVSDETTQSLVSTPLADPDATETGPTADLGPGPDPGQPTTTVVDDRDVDRNRNSLPKGTALRYFGDYEIRRELGRGGMGVVYEARQVSLNRPVALKMLKAGLLADDDDLRRFRNEAEAIALLDHPGVVPVYEVGEHRGQHYFSMKLIPGGSLVPRIDAYTRDPRATARLIAEAAEAVAHAHARGILHRDLKPANILVDDRGRPHVTDFGLAKRVEGDVELTQSGAILGTPAYMAPEQATGHRGAVTTASDVYGLGAVLYAMLTGRAPFSSDSVVETLDAVRNAPPKPPRKLNGRVPRDLETICLKCLEKDPRRRYPTAQALADDLRAWLESRPIAARRVGAAERAWLWCRRRPAIASLSAATAMALVGGTATVIAVQAKANADLLAANRRVEQRYDLTVEAIKTFHTGVSEDFLLQQDQFRALRDRLLKSAADFYGKLGAMLDRETDFASRRALAASNFELANLTAKVGRDADAMAAHRAVLAAREAMAAEPGADAGTQTEVGRSLTAVGALLQVTGKMEEAAAAYRRAESVLAGPAGAADASAREALAACRSRLGWLLSDTGRPAEALAAYKRALADQEALAASPQATDDARSDLALTVMRIGVLLHQMGRFAEAEVEDRRSLALYRKLAEERPAAIDFRRSLANTHSNLGVLLNVTGRPAEAEAEYRRALAIRRDLVQNYPAVLEFRSRLADSHNNLGELLGETGKPAEEEAEYRRALAIRRELVQDHPALTEFASRLAGTHISLAWVLARTGRPAEAEAEYRHGLALYRKLAEDHPAVTGFRSGLANSENNLAWLLSSTGRPAEAAAEYRRSQAHYRELAEDHSGVPEFRKNLAQSHNRLGWLLLTTGEPAAAEVDFRAALALYRKLAEDHPNVPDYRDQAANLENNLSVALRRLGQPLPARDHAERAVAAREAAVRDSPGASGYRADLAENLLNRGRARCATGDPAGAAADLRRATAIYDALPSRTNDEWFFSACAHAVLAGLAGAPGSGISAAEASAAADTAMARLRKAIATGYRERDAFRIEDALDSLRDRLDFRLLMMDLLMPADPFARRD